MSDGVFWPEFEAWLLAHGIEPNRTRQVQVTWTPESTRGPVYLEVTTFKLRDGKPYLDEDGDIAAETTEVPMRHLPSVDVVRGEL